MDSAKRIGKMLNLLASVSPKLAGKAAFKIFCTPRYGRLRDKDRAFLDHAQKGAFTVEDLTIRTYEWPAGADAPVVVFVHGWESNSARWQKFIQAMRQAGYTVRAFDAPAHGDSGGKILNLPLYSRTLKAYLERHGAPHALVGHSIGGAAVIMSMGAFGAPRPQKAVILGAFSDTERVVRDFANILDVNTAVWEALGSEIERKSGRPLRAFKIAPLTEILHDVNALIMHDAHDEIAPLHESKELADAWPGAVFQETRELGHRMQDKSVVKAVREWITG